MTGPPRSKTHKRKTEREIETGEGELMSGIEEEEPSKELRIARDIGAWSLNVRRQTANPTHAVSSYMKPDSEV